MESWNIVEILKLGLPGLVFLLSTLSYRLLSKEQGKEHPNPTILSAIKSFMYINVVLAVLTLASPLIDNEPSKPIIDNEPLKSEDMSTFDTIQIHEVEAKSGITDLEVGTAAVCHGAGYINKYLLVRDKNTGKLIQVFAKTLIPCTESKIIALNQNDVRVLGWSPEANSSNVEIDVAKPGFMFALGTS